MKKFELFASIALTSVACSTVEVPAPWTGLLPTDGLRKIALPKGRRITGLYEDVGVLELGKRTEATMAARGLKKTCGNVEWAAGRYWTFVGDNKAYVANIQDLKGEDAIILSRAKDTDMSLVGHLVVKRCLPKSYHVPR